jgi:hypothetical protein
MATERQLEIDQAFLSALREYGDATDTEFLIAVTSERTKAEYRDIVEALAALHLRRNRRRA